MRNFCSLKTPPSFFYHFMCWITKNGHATVYEYLFCLGLESLDVSGWNMSNFFKQWASKCIWQHGGRNFIWTDFSRSNTLYSNKTQKLKKSIIYFMFFFRHRTVYTKMLFYWQLHTKRIFYDKFTSSIFLPLRANTVKKSWVLL